MATPRRTRATLADIMPRLEREEQVELVAGEIVDRAMPTAAHGAVQTKVGAVLSPFNRRPGGPRGPGGWWILTETDILYPRTEEVFRHDLSGFRRDLHEARPNDFPVRARPDWACEISSPSTTRRDQVEKQRTLHAHGVPHYWRIDPVGEVLTVLRWREEGYLLALNAGVGDVVRAEPFERIELEVSELFGE
jgi:Uma2 family endonuclease